MDGASPPIEPLHLVLLNVTKNPIGILRKVTFVSDLYQTVRTSYFIVGVKRMDLWSHGSVTAYLSL